MSRERIVGSERKGGRGVEGGRKKGRVEDK